MDEVVRAEGLARCPFDENEKFVDINPQRNQATDSIAAITSAEQGLKLGR